MIRTYYGRIDPNEVAHKLVRNPAYPGIGTGFAGCVGVPLVPAPNKRGFHAALERSIRDEGIRNPPLLYLDGERFYVGFGGSRVLAAQRAGAERIPALVNVAGNTGPATRGRIEQRSLIRRNRSPVKFFQDPPEWWEWTELGLDYHYSIEKNRRDTFDPAGLAWTEGLEDQKFLDKEFSWLKR